MRTENRRACIIGCGAISRAHADALKALPSVELVAAADIRPERAKAFAVRYGCRAYEDWRKMLSEQKPDAVHICTPHFLHAPMAVYALQHGVPVLIEKPVALSPEEARGIIAARDSSHRYAGTVFQNRLNDSTQAAKEAADSGKYGRILGVKGIVTWHRDRDYYQNSGWRGKFSTEGGGVLMNQSIHTLDLLRYFAGEVDSLCAFTANWSHAGVIEVEDTAAADLKFQSGARGIFYATTANATDSPAEVEITLEKAVIVLRGSKATLRLGSEERDLCAPGGTQSPYKLCWGQSHGRLIERFYDVLAGSLAPEKGIVALEEGVAALEIISAIYRSSHSGKPEKVRHS